MTRPPPAADPLHRHFSVPTDDGFICGICGRWSPMPFPDDRDPAAVDPLQRARADAERALRDRLDAAGWPAPAQVAELFAEVAIAVIWPHAKRAYRPRTEDGRP